MPYGNATDLLKEEMNYGQLHTLNYYLSLCISCFPMLFLAPKQPFIIKFCTLICPLGMHGLQYSWKQFSKTFHKCNWPFHKKDINYGQSHTLKIMIYGLKKTYYPSLGLFHVQSCLHSYSRSKPFVIKSGSLKRSRFI